MDDLKRFTIEIPSTGRVIEVWQKGHGPDVVFLHGAGGFPGFSPDLEALAKTCRVTVPLFPGFGLSTGIDDIDGVHDAALHNFDVLKTLRISKPHIIGHSMGGMLAAEMAATAPNDVGKLVLVAPVGLWDDAHPVLDFFTVMPQDIAKYVFHNKKHPLAIAMSMMPEPDDEGIVDLYVNYIKGLSAAGRLLWPIPDRGLKKRLYRIATPTLILWGESDGLVPLFYAKEFQKRIPGSRVKTIKEASHMVMLEQPKAAASAILQFLAEGPSKTAKPEPSAKITLLSTAPPPPPIDQRAKIAAAAHRSTQKHLPPAPAPAAHPKLPAPPKLDKKSKSSTARPAPNAKPNPPAKKAKPAAVNPKPAAKKQAAKGKPAAKKALAKKAPAKKAPAKKAQKPKRSAKSGGKKR